MLPVYITHSVFITSTLNTFSTKNYVIMEKQFLGSYLEIRDLSKLMF